MAELVYCKIDVILAANVAATVAATKATNTISIVMLAFFDPVGIDVVKSLERLLEQRKVKIHLVGHSAGSILLGHFLDVLRANGLMRIASCTLLAPACTVQFALDHYWPLVPTTKAG